MCDFLSTHENKKQFCLAGFFNFIFTWMCLRCLKSAALNRPALLLNFSQLSVDLHFKLQEKLAHADFILFEASKIKRELWLVCFQPVSKKCLWCDTAYDIVFADGIVICSEIRQQLEENMERWRFTVERSGMKVSSIKTEYRCVNER